ncbi:hypothetical protein CDAR_558991 [Caerostris darwini]|uniref:Uncharacterized protein n=1 Tax=Caerostris darwini TaxID=1538125 RepID=A0AAV4X3T4_9ARAC|nr:hypothetical protein CDAR_558991 [Caerostris darwini]
MLAAFCKKDGQEYHQIYSKHKFPSIADKARWETACSLSVTVPPYLFPKSLVPLQGMFWGDLRLVVSLMAGFGLAEFILECLRVFPENGM